MTKYKAQQAASSAVQRYLTLKLQKKETFTYFRPLDENKSILLFSQATHTTCLK